MQQVVAERGGDTDATTDLDQRRPLEDATCRGESQRQKQQDHRPVAGRQRGLARRQRAELIEVPTPGDLRCRHQAGLAIDGSSSTVWPIDTYSDPVPFPNFKNGVGLMLQLPQPSTLGEVTINLNSTGTAVEIRSSETPTPSSLDDTTELTPATPLKPGSNTIKVDNASPTSNVLVWVSTLGTVNGENRSDIAEVTLKAAS